MVQDATVIRPFLLTRTESVRHSLNIAHVRMVTIVNSSMLQIPDAFLVPTVILCIGQLIYAPIVTIPTSNSFRKTVPRVMNLRNARLAWIRRHPDIAILVRTTEQTTKIVHHLESTPSKTVALRHLLDLEIIDHSKMNVTKLVILLALILQASVEI